MKLSAIVLAAIAGAVLAAAPALAEEASAAAGATDVSALTELDDDRTDIGFQGMSLEDAESMPVYAAAGEEIGEIEDFLGDGGGAVTAVVVETENGFLGLRERELVFPAANLALDRERRRFTTDLAQADVENLQVWDD